MSELLDTVERLVSPALEAERIELVDLTFQNEPGGWTLCFYLDKEGGITLDDCESWSRRLGEILDAANIIERSYNLEVSSPGLNRAIRKTADFARFSGRRVNVKLYAPLNGQKNYHGILLGGDDEEIRVGMEGDRVVALPRQQIAKCRLDPVIDF